MAYSTASLTFGEFEDIVMNGGLIKLKNKACNCGSKVVLKVSESQKNPTKLFYCCSSVKVHIKKILQPNQEVQTIFCIGVYITNKTKKSDQKVQTSFCISVYIANKTKKFK